MLIDAVFIVCRRRIDNESNGFGIADDFAYVEEADAQRDADRRNKIVSDKLNKMIESGEYSDYEYRYFVKRLSVVDC